MAGLDHQEKPPIILIAGFGISGKYLIPTANVLVRRHPVYIPDVPRTGDSTKTKGVLKLPPLAAFLDTWMDRLAIKKAVFLGNSCGCQIIAEIGLRFPRRVQSAVMVGPTVDPRKRNVLASLLERLTDSFDESPQQIPLAVEEYLFKTGLRRFLLWVQDCFNDRIEEKLPRLKFPVLVVRGSRDPAVTERWARESARLLAWGKKVTIKDKGHTLNFNGSEELGAVTRKFLRECGGNGKLRKKALRK